jgi:hypothetical protein
MTKIQWPADDKLTNLINLHKSYTNVAKILNCDPESVRLRVYKRKLNVNIKKQNYLCNESVFLNKDNLSYYLLGAYISDGNVEKYTNRIGITSIDKDWITQIRNIVSPNAPITKSKTTDAYIFRFSNAKIRNWFIENECIPNKSLIAKFPKIPQKYLRDFIRGIFDGDGSISAKFYLNSSKFSRTNKKYCYEYISSQIHSGSKEFIEALSVELKKNKLNHLISSEINRISTMKNGRKIKSNNPLYRITFNCKDAFNFLKWIYYSDNNLYLNRKRIKAEEIFSYYETS